MAGGSPEHLRDGHSKGGSQMNMLIRRAHPEDCAELTLLSFASKRYWNYPEKYFEIWKSELTITVEYMRANRVFLAENEQDIIGYFSIVEVKDAFWAGKVFINKGFWLEHMYVNPRYIKCGIGTKLINYAKNYCHQQKIHFLYIFVDPNANGFYDKMGASYLGESLSSIDGRMVSEYRLDIE